MLEPAQLAALFTERRLVTPLALALGRRAWEAYTDADPRGAAALAEQDSEALPFVRQAFRHHCERFPSVATGLNEIETAALDDSRAGARRLRRAVPLGHCGSPRATAWNGRRAARCLRARARAAGQHLGADVTAAEVSLTALGREVLAGRRDWLSVRAIDVWLGGVHLEGDRPRWRWDGAHRRLVESPT